MIRPVLKFISLLLLLCSLQFSIARAQVFKTGDKVCFIGNSITMNGGFYHQLALYYATRYPGIPVEFINCGINGNVAANVLSRMDSDILVNKPNWAVLMLGMNDVHKELYHPDSVGKPGIDQRRQEVLATYRSNYQLIIERLLKEKCKVILQTPSIYDQTAQIAAVNYAGRNDALQRCSEIVRELALKYKLPVTDYQGIMLSVNQQMQATNPSATLIGADRVHPGAAGHFVMAYQFLKETHQTYPKSVIELDLKAINSSHDKSVKGGKVSEHLSAELADLQVTPNEIRFTATEKTLPFPIERESAEGPRLVPFRDFNQNILRITGLNKGIYALSVDNIEIGKYTDYKIDKGIDLSVCMNIPQYRQARRILQLYGQYWKLEADQRYVRLIESYKQAKNERYRALKEKYSANVREMKELLKEIYRINKPVAHHWTLRLVNEEGDVVAASQAGASPLFFQATSAPQIKVSDFNDERELKKRNGLSAFFARVRAGKAATIAYIGGSVTQMDNKYRNQSAKFLQEMYPNAKMTFINAGVSGTGTDLGASRLQYQVLDYQPDLVFVEFAVNGSFVPGMEGIIRQIHQANPNTGICLLYSISTGQSALYAKGELPDNIVGLEKLADHYGVPSIHMGMEVSALEAAGRLVWKADPALVKDRIVFSKDGTHPTTEGGNLYAAAIARSLVKMAADTSTATRAISYPRPLSSDNWEDGSALDPSAVSYSSGWKRTIPANDTLLKQFAPWFPYVMEAEKPGSSFTFTFEGTKVGVFDIGGPEVGQLEIYIDGKKQAVINRFNRFCNNRYRGQYFFIDTKPGVHHVEFKIAVEIPDKKQILGEEQLQDIKANPSKYSRSVVYIGKILIKGRQLDASDVGNTTDQTLPQGLPALSQQNDTTFNIFSKINAAQKIRMFHGYRMAEFTFNGRACKIVQPKIALQGHPWIWRARFWGHEPQFDLAMLALGFHVVYSDVAELFGNQESVSLWNRFYALMQTAGLAPKAVLEGMSRGGVYAYNWAAENPDKVACIYADNPVLDLKSWPGGMGKGSGSKADWQKVIVHYKLDTDRKIAKFRGSPIHKIRKIVKGGYPMLHVCGDADELVPMSENTLPFEQLIRTAGGNITIIHKPGAKHHPHSLVDPQPIVDFVLKAVFK